MYTYSSHLADASALQHSYIRALFNFTSDGVCFTLIYDWRGGGGVESIHLSHVSENNRKVNFLGTKLFYGKI